MRHNDGKQAKAEVYKTEHEKGRGDFDNPGVGWLVGVVGVSGAKNKRLHHQRDAHDQSWPAEAGTDQSGTGEGHGAE